MGSSYRHRTDARAVAVTVHRARRLAGVAALGLAAGALGPTAAGAAPHGFAESRPADGRATEIAGAHGTVAWLTTPDAHPSRTTRLHVERGGLVSDVAIDTTRYVERLSVGTDTAGRPLVLAVAHDGRVPGTQAGLRRPDIVRIDPATGRVTPLPAGSRRTVAESAASVDDGRVVIARRADGGRAAIYRTTLRSTHVERLRSTAGSTATSRAEVIDLAVSPRAGSAPTYALTTTETNPRTEFTEQRLLVGRGAHTPRRVQRTVASGSSFAGLHGLSWQTDSRLWFARFSEEGSSLRRYSTWTRRQAAAASDERVRDAAWVSDQGGVVATVSDDPGGDVRDTRLYATGPLRPAGR